MSEDAVGTNSDAELVDALAQSAFLTMGALTRLAAEHELSLTQLRVLAILRDRRLQIGDLAAHLGLEKSTLTGLVSRAERRGLVRRRPSETDRRGVLVELDASGRDLARRVSRAMKELLDPQLRALRPAEREELGRLLSKAVGAATPEA